MLPIKRRARKRQHRTLALILRCRPWIIALNRAKPRSH